MNKEQLRVDLRYILNQVSLTSNTHDPETIGKNLQEIETDLLELIHKVEITS